jgi:hypothetical protein
MQALSLLGASNPIVVRNDKPVAALELPKSPQPVAKSLTDIETRRQQWETTAYRTSNQQLYAVLADCLEFGKALELGEAKKRSADLEEFFKQRGYFYKKESPLLTRIVKAVFGNVDRRRISTYSLVLRSAQKEEIAAEKLSEWIEINGGIQEIKLARSDSYVSPKAKAAKAKSTLSALPNLAVAKDKLAELADASYLGCECLLLAEQQSDGSFHIKALSRSAAAINAALSSLYSEQQKAAA